MFYKCFFDLRSFHSSIIKILNLYIILSCTHLHHFFPVSIHNLQCIHSFFFKLYSYHSTVVISHKMYGFNGQNIQQAVHGYWGISLFLHFCLIFPFFESNDGKKRKNVPKSNFQTINDGQSTCSLVEIYSKNIFGKNSLTPNATV